MEPEPTTSRPQKPWNTSLIVALLSLVLAGIALARGCRPATVGPSDGVASTSDDSLSRFLEKGTIKAGYGGFPPYTVIDLNESDADKRVKGFSADLLREIARRHEPP